MYLTIPVRPVMSAKFSGLKNYVAVDDQSETSFLISRGTLPQQPVFVSFIHRTDFGRASG